eukprot:Gb_09682 [translate_table: standard]
MITLLRNKIIKERTGFLCFVSSVIPMPALDMTSYLALWLALGLMVVAVSADSVSLPNSHALGINYGRVADNLPAPSKAIELMKDLKVGYVKIYDADPEVLKALSNTNLQVVITVKNQEISSIASDSSNADKWVQSNVLPYYPSTRIYMIMVGNEVLSDNQNQATWSQLVPAMKNVHSALLQNKLDDAIKITTSVAMDAFSSSYPPSNGSFRQDIATSVMQPMLNFLNGTDSYFFLDVYPFFAWSSNPVNISLDYALFGLGASKIKDGAFQYSNMLDAQLDATVAAMAELGYPQVKLAISETGWPSKGDSDQAGANLVNAARYNRRLVTKLLSSPPSGTPRRPKTFIPSFLFSLFNEDQKPGATTERNWGVFYPDGTPVYNIDLSGATKESDYAPVSQQHQSPGVVKADTNKPNSSATPASSPSSQWCVVKQNLDSADDTDLQAALDYACGAGADCSAIQTGQICYEPNTLAAHASYAFNSFWQNTKSHGGTCDFNGAAILTNSNPSFQGCSFTGN